MANDDTQTVVLNAFTGSHWELTFDGYITLSFEAEDVKVTFGGQT